MVLAHLVRMVSNPGFGRGRVQNDGFGAAQRPAIWAALFSLYSVLASDAFALNSSRVPKGVDYLAAHDLTTGAGIGVGVIELGGRNASQNGINFPYFHGQDQLKAQFDFNDTVPPLMADPALSTGSDDHATLVSDVILSKHPVYRGVAPDADLYLASGGNSRWLLLGATDWLSREYGVHIFNHSTTSLSQQPAWDIDWLTTHLDTLHIIAAGNSAQYDSPVRGHALSYNGLTVGGIYWDKQTRWNASTFETQNTGRNKPDLIASATIGNGPSSEPRLYMYGTSFAAPHAVGVAALLASEGLTVGTGEPRNRMAQRAIMMNSARKRFINAYNELDATFSVIKDYGPTAGFLESGAPVSHDSDYLIGRNLRVGASSTLDDATDDWTPSAWSTDASGVLSVVAPLDDELGTGMLDAHRALIQHQGGHQEHDGVNSSGVSAIGWHRGSLAGVSDPDRFTFAPRLDPRSFITATLVWEIETVEENVEGGTVGVVDYQDQYRWGELPNFELSIFRGDDLVAESIGTLDTVEHLHIPVDGGGEDYSLVVDLLGQEQDVRNYAIAWWASAHLAGDYNNNGQVEQGDLDLVLQNWGIDTESNGIPAAWISSLPTGLVDQAELDSVLTNWGSTSAPNFRGLYVPEPVVLVVFAPALAVLRRAAAQ